MTQTAHNPVAFIQSGRLKQILDKSARLSLLQQHLSDFLDPEMAQHCLLLNVKPPTLVLGVSSSLWLHRLRFLEPSLLNLFQPHINNLTTIQWKVIEPGA